MITKISFVESMLCLLKIFNVRYAFVVGHKYPVCSCSGAPVSMIGVVAHVLAKSYNLQRVLILLIKANFFIVIAEKVLLNLKDGVPFKFKIKYAQFNVKESLSIDTTFNPP